MTHLADALARYVAALEAGALETNHAQDRSSYVAHLAAAARMFSAIHTGSLYQLKAIVVEERHSYGWSYLSGKAGDSTEAAFDAFAKQVENA